MLNKSFENSDVIRSNFAAAMSEMYRQEVPDYGTLVDMVGLLNDKINNSDDLSLTKGSFSGGMDRISLERHGAIRVGLPSELSMMRRIFSIMNMHPVGYYDLSVADIPVHSTAFRPIDEKSLDINPFRIFTSLLRLEMIQDEKLRALALEILEGRNIFSERLIELVDIAENQEGLSEREAANFVTEVLDIFRWRKEANVSHDVYRDLLRAHGLVADIVSFKGPHINHLTPRTLDIDDAQSAMKHHNINPKAIVEGPPKRKCPILLRQTSFKALEEDVLFAQDSPSDGATHTARFGEIEQRGAALTPKGRRLYDQLLATVRSKISPAGDGSNAVEYYQTLSDVFSIFPDDWESMRKEGLIYCCYYLTNTPSAINFYTQIDVTIDELVQDGLVDYLPVTYEDFLPVSAAGIFQSNLNDNAVQEIIENPQQSLFEENLGSPVFEEFSLYETIEQQSISNCMARLQEFKSA